MDHRATWMCVKSALVRNVDAYRAGDVDPRHVEANVRRLMPRLVCWLKGRIAMGGGADSSEPDRFVPYAAGFTAPKVATLVDVVLASFRARGIDARARGNVGSALATCLAAALFWTAPGVRALGVVPVPWAKTFGRNLARRLLTAWRRGEVRASPSGACWESQSRMRVWPWRQRLRKSPA